MDDLLELVKQSSELIEQLAGTEDLEEQIELMELLKPLVDEQHS